MKKKRRWLLPVLVLIFLGIAGYILILPKQEALTQVAVQTGTIETYYNFEGNVTAPGQQSISASAADTVRDVYVVANQYVKKDDRLLKLTNGGTVSADRDGEITGLFVRTNDVVSAGQILVQIADLDAMEIEVKVDEYDIGAVDIGKSAQVTIEAIDQTVEASITKINKLATATGDLSYYNVTLSFDQPQVKGVLPGMRVSAKILNARAENVTILKMSALRFDDYNQPYVLIKKEKEVQEVPVTVGISDGVNVEILSGVQAGENVLEGEKQGTMVERMMEMRRDMVGRK